MTFDFDGARASGYSDSEIIDHVKAKPDLGFDIDSARTSGYSDAEIVDHLKTRTPKATKTAEQPSLLKRARDAITTSITKPVSVPAAQTDPLNVSDIEPAIDDAVPSPDSQFTKGLKTGWTGAKQMLPAIGTIPTIGAMKTLNSELGAYDRIDKGEAVRTLGGDFVAQRARMYQNSPPEMRAKLRETAIQRVGENQEIKDALIQSWKAYAEELKKHQGRTPNLTDVRDVKGFGDWFAFNFGQGLPYMSASALSTLIGGALGGPGGAAIGLGGSGYAMGLGDIQGELIEKSKEDQAGLAVVGAVPYGALDFLGPAGRTLRNVTGTTLKEVDSNYFRRLGREVPANLVEEFINEAGQEVVKDAAVTTATGEKLVTDESLLRWFNAGAAGSAAAGPFAAVSAVPGPKQAKPQPMPGSRGDLEDVLNDPRPLESIRAEQAAQQQERDAAAMRQAEASRESMAMIADEQAQGAAVRAQERSVRNAQEFGLPAIGSRVAVGDVAGTLAAVHPAENGWDARVVTDDGETYAFLQEDGYQVVPEAFGDGTREAPVQVEHAAHVEQAAQQVETQPTEAQKEAGNYSKAHVKIHGLDISIENPKGSERSGRDAGGNEWRVQMPAAYGYVKRTEGADGDQVDVYIGDNPQSQRVFVVDQIDPATGNFDEHKALIGFDQPSDAVKTYQAGFSDGSGMRRIGAVSEMSTDEFKAWLKTGETTKPVAYQKPETKRESDDVQGNAQVPPAQVAEQGGSAGMDDKGVAAPAQVPAAPLPNTIPADRQPVAEQPLKALEKGQAGRLAAHLTKNGFPSKAIPHPTVSGKYAVVEAGHQEQAPSVEQPAVKPEAAAQPKPAEAKKKGSAYRGEDLLQVIRRRGGINMRYLQDITGESNVAKARVPFGLFKKDGDGLDSLARILAMEDHFPIDPEAADDTDGVAQLTDLLQRALGGEKVWPHDVAERKMAEEQEKEYRRATIARAKELGIRTVARPFEQIEAELDIRTAVAPAGLSDAERAAFDELKTELFATLGEDAAADLLERLAVQYEQASEAEFIAAVTPLFKEAIHEAETREVQVAEAAPAEPRAEQPVDRDAGSPEEAPGGSPAAAQQEVLSAYSAADLAAKQSRAEDETVAAREAADREREAFTLTPQTQEKETGRTQQGGLFTPTGKVSVQANQEQRSTTPVAESPSPGEVGESPRESGDGEVATARDGAAPDATYTQNQEHQYGPGLASQEAMAKARELPRDSIVMEISVRPNGDKWHVAYISNGDGSIESAVIGSQYNFDRTSILAEAEKGRKWKSERKAEAGAARNDAIRGASAIGIKIGTTWAGASVYLGNRKGLTTYDRATIVGFNEETGEITIEGYKRGMRAPERITTTYKSRLLENYPGATATTKSEEISSSLVDEKVSHAGTELEPWQMTKKEVGSSLNAKGWKSARGVMVVAPSPESGLYETTHNSKTDVYLSPDEAEQYMRDYNATAHRRHVEYALAQGKPVPTNVLADYPDLKVSPAETANTAQPENPIQSLLDRYDEGDDALGTVEDLADAAEALAVETDNADLADLVAEYRRNLKEDMEEFGGRGDPDQYEQELIDGMAALAKAEKISPASTAAGHKAGDQVKLTKPGLNGRVNISGTVTKILPDGRLEVRTQQDGYMTVAESELGHKPTVEGGRKSTDITTLDRLSRKIADGAGGRPVYLRFTKDAEGDARGRRSSTWTTKEREAGLSVVALSNDDGLNVYVSADDALPPSHPVNLGGAVSNYIDYLDFRGATGAYLLTGDIQGVGTDGEPLLKNAQIVGEVAPEVLFEAYQAWADSRKDPALSSSVAQKIGKLRDVIGGRKGGKQEVSTQGKIEDFGEKITGARKDYAAVLREAREVDIAAAPLSKSWPEPDYQKLIDGGADRWAVGFMHAARDEIPTKPQQAWKLRSWVGKVEMLRDTAAKMLSGEIDPARAKELLKDDKWKSLRDVESRIDLYMEVGHEKSLKGIRIAAGDYGVFNGQQYSPPKRIWTVEAKAAKTAMSHWPKTLASGDTREEAIAAFKATWLKAPEDSRADAKIDFGIYSRAGKFFVGKKIGAHVVELKSGFESAREARAWKDANQEELVGLLEKFKEVPSERKAENSPRVGTDHRSGADVTPDRFMESFGFRGVQFGNYVENNRRQADLNETYDALMDLAGVLDIPPKALSLNGELGLAFGARGTGGKNAPLAHYEPGQIVINLTKKRGVGSLAHEWFHAVDNYFSRMGGAKSGYLTETQAAGEGVRPEMVAAFRLAMRAINGTALKARAQILDQTRAKPYWSTGLEMAARAFESYVVAKLQDQGASNDYLANIVSEDYWNAAAALGMKKEGSYPYPVAAEVPEIRSAFDNFFKTVETKETDKGVALFSRAAYNESDGFLPETGEQRTTIDAERLADLRRQAAGLEKPEAGVHLRVTETGEAIATGPKGVRVPQSFTGFAEANGLRFMARRRLPSPVVKSPTNISEISQYSHPMPVDYRAAGALYFNEMGEAWLDRTGKARLSRTLTGEDTKVTTLFTLLTDQDGIFKYPKSEAIGMAEIAAEVDPTMYVDDMGTSAYSDRNHYWNVVMENGTVATVTTDEVKKEVWLNAALLEEGRSGGSALYALVGNWAHNNGYVFVADPGGVSNPAIYRRTENMISLALKFGSTDFLAPHEDQLQRVDGKRRGEPFYWPGMQWKTGDTAFNLNQMLEASYNAVKHHLPGIKNIYYDFDSGQFRDASTGREYSGSDFVALSRRAGARAAHAGRTTLERSALAGTVLSGKVDGAEWRALLGKLVEQQGDAAGPTLQGRLYSRGERGALSAGEVEEVVSRLRENWRNAPRISVVESVADLPFPAPADVEGAYWRGQIWLVAGNLNDPQRVQFTVFHEGLGHYGLRGFFGKELEPVLQRLWSANKQVRSRAAKWIRENQDVIKEHKMAAKDAHFLSIEEALADIAGSGEKITGLKKLIAWVQEWLRANGFDQVADWLEAKTDAEVLAVLADARTFVEEGRQFGESGQLAPVYHRAFHGGPHDFEEFSTEHIGSGEGAQAYGWGLYFSGRQEVAKWYKEKLSDRQTEIRTLSISKDGKTLRGEEILAEYYKPGRVVQTMGGSFDKVLSYDAQNGYVTVERYVDKNATKRDPYHRGTTTYSGLHWTPSEVRRVFKPVLEADGWKFGTGRIYEVELAPKEDEYLDWDKRLSEQSEKVKEALQTTPVIEKWASSSWKKNGLDGGPTGSHLYETLTEKVGGKKQASETLRSTGIRGIRYLDGISRSKGEGHHNFVIFDDKDVTITAKFSRAAKESAEEANAALTDDAGIPDSPEVSNLFGADRSLPKDLNLFKRLALHPRMIAAMDKDFTPVFQTASDQFERRDEIAAMIQHEAQPYFDLPRAGKERVSAVLELGRLQGEVFGRGKEPVVAENTGQDARLSKPGDTLELTDAEKSGYWGVRRAMDKALNLFRDQFLREQDLPADVKTAKDILELAQQETDGAEAERLMRIAAVIREIEQARRTGYVPFTRWGKVGIVVEKTVGAEKKTLHFEKVELDSVAGKAERLFSADKRRLGNVREVKERLATLEGKYPGANIRLVNLADPKEAATVDMIALDHLAQLAQINENVWDAVKDQLDKAKKATGFRKHFFGSRNIPGYSADFERAIADYIVGISGYLARREYLPKWEAAIEGISSTKPQLVDYARNYQKYANTPVEELSALRQTVFFYYLSGVPATAMVNATQVPMITAPYLTQFANPAQVTASLTRAYKDALAMLTVRKGLDIFDPAKAPTDMREALQHAWDQGFFVPLQTFEMMGLAQNRSKVMRGLSKKTRTAMEVVSLQFTMAERLNRLVTFIAAYRMAKREGFGDRAKAIMADNALAQSELAEFTPEAFAEWVIDETHYRMGKVNRPAMMRGVGTAILQFKSFTWQTLELYSRLATLHGREGNVALGLMMLALLFVAGLWGLPGAEDLRDLFESLYKKLASQDKDVKTDLRVAVAEMTGSAKIAELISHGAPRAIEGMPEISRRIGMGDLLPAANEDALGVPFDLTYKRLSRAVEYQQRDRTMLAVAELMPNFVKHPMTAWAWSKEGVKSAATGRPVIPPEKLTTEDLALKAVGFTPADVAEYREMENSRRRAERGVDDKRREWYSKVAATRAEIYRAEQKGDSEAAKVAEKRLIGHYEDIQRHNEQAKPEDIIRLDPKTVQKKTAEEILGADIRKKQTRKQARGRAEQIEKAYGF